MKLRPLLIGQVEEHNLRVLKEHAEANPLSMDDMLDIMNLSEPPPGDRPGFSVIIPVDYRITFTIDAQPDGPARHLSISVLPPTKGVYPNPEAVLEMCKCLGFKETEDFEKFTSVYMQDDYIINVIEYL